MTRRKSKRNGSAFREPSGRLQRDSRPAQREDMRQIALDGRQRAFALTPEQSARMAESTVLARLCVTGEISEAQRETGEWYRGVVREYDRMMLARGLPAPGDYNRSHGHDDSDGTDDEYTQRFKRARELFARCSRALAECGDRMARTATNAVVVDDRNVPHLITPSLRIGLDALGHLRGPAAARKAPPHKGRFSP